MANLNEVKRENRFVVSILPWLVAVAALIFYLLTLNHWVSLNSLTYVARATHQTWLPELTGSTGGFGPYEPALFAATYPIRFLPEKWIPLALNLFSALCAALTLGLLARCVVLLPHDRTHQQRQREHSPFSLLSIPSAWIPPVLAATVLGLQRSCWESATAISDDAFEVLLLAYVVRCLLEYRVDARDSWLLQAAVVWGVAITGNWLYIALLPGFVVSLVWIRGLTFFNIRFLLKMALAGLAGLTLYLLLPTVCVFSGNRLFGFWDGLKSNLLSQQEMLTLYFLHLPRYLQLLLVTTSLLPLLLIGIRWASHFGDPSRMGIAVTTGTLHVASGALMMAGIWVAFDPVFSPQSKGLILPELNFLGALSVGYFVGYFLLVFRPIFNRMGRAPAWQVGLNRVAQATIWALLVLVPLGLISKNLPDILLTNGPVMRQYAAALTQNLPPRGVILCDSQTKGDFPLRLWLARAWLARSGRVKDYIFADTFAMQVPQYHQVQQKRYGSAWPVPVLPRNARGVPTISLMRMVAKYSEEMPVYYLHPTFGYYIEIFYQQPHGLAFEMKRYPTNSINRPLLTPAEVAENDKFWKADDAALGELIPWIQRLYAPQKAQGFRGWWMKKMHIPPEPNRTALMLGRLYSHTLDFWAVQLQRSGRWREAGHYFDLALALNPDNVAAKASIRCNDDLRNQRPTTAPAQVRVAEELGKYRDWLQVLRDNGLFDDPLHCVVQAAAFIQGRLTRQGAQQLERVLEFDPDYLPGRLWLARFYASTLPSRSLSMLSEIRRQPDLMKAQGVRPGDLSITEAIALFASRKTPEAEHVLEQAMRDNPGDEALLSTIVQVAGTFGRITNALVALDRELQISPTNVSALVIKGYLKLQTGEYAHAIPPLTLALSIDTNNQTARFNRAIAYLRGNQLDEAQKDYEVLEKYFPNSFRIYYGLGEIAWRKSETNRAIHYYELYLSNSVPNSEEARLINERLQSLNPPSP